MPLIKLPSLFSDECLSDTPEDILGLFDVAWAGYQKLTLKPGQALVISNAESLHDFVRTSFIAILSGQAQFDGRPNECKPGDAFVLEQWHTAQIETDTGAELLLARTCGKRSSFTHQLARKKPFFRLEMTQAQRLPSPADLAEILQALMTGMLGATPMTFTELCDDVLCDWRLRYHEPLKPERKVEQLADIIREFVKQSRHVLVGHELVNGQPADEVVQRWFNHWLDFDAVRKNLAVPSLAESLQAKVALFEQPVFIVAAPRSGSTMLFEALSANRVFWTIGDESHQVFESIKELHPASQSFSSNRLTEKQLNGAVGTAVVDGFLRRLRDASGQRLIGLEPEQQPSALRFLEKTPKNALRIPFLKALFPDAKFVFLHRRAKPNIGSMIDAWKSGNFVTYPKLPGWVGSPWSLLLCDRWADLKNKPLGHIAAWQWASTNQQILDDLSDLATSDWCAVSYESILEHKTEALKAICDFADVPFGPRMQALAAAPLAPSKYTLSSPDTEKWRRHQSAIDWALKDTKLVGEVSAALGALPNLGNI